LPYSGVDNLEVMAAAVNYTRFVNDAIVNAIGSASRQRRVLDFGAGTGTHCSDLRDRGYDVHCVELDEQLCERLRTSGFPAAREVADLAEGNRYAGIYTVNVLEHIENHHAAMRDMAAVLADDGRLIIYVPALPLLFTAMDRKVGHVRRYRRAELVNLALTAGLAVERCEYVDSLGVPATLAYKLIGSNQGDLNPSSIALYDRWLFPLSRLIDRATHRWFGKNLLLVARKP
jgi:SAM-dependent methyltransferase